eukprot:8612500-Ditylum_brightwellii.AAC.1
MTSQPAGKTVKNVCTFTHPKSFPANNFDKPPLLPVPRNDEIKPRDKFAALLAVIQQQYTDTTLKQWNAHDTNQAQSIISGLDLPHERENLAVFCPYFQRNTQLEMQWRLKFMA